MEDNRQQLYFFISLIIAAIVLCGYFTFFVREYLPAYDDENMINFYTDGYFRMNIPGMYFSNSNWPIFQIT